MGKVFLTAFPYAMQEGVIDVPDGVDVMAYVADHLDDVEFEEPELDYDKVEFLIDEEWGRWR